jgi:hypothetical protein
LINGHSVGKGSLTTDTKSIIVASWDFECLSIEDQPTAQLLKFNVEYVEGKPANDVGFTLSFKQVGTTNIMRIESGITQEDSLNWLAPAFASPMDEYTDFPQFSIEDEIADLESMKAEVAYLQYLIEEKERMLNEIMDVERIQECDSLKCIVRFALDKARGAAKGAFSMVTGGKPFDPENEGMEDFDMHHGPKPSHFSGEKPCDKKFGHKSDHKKPGHKSGHKKSGHKFDQKPHGMKPWGEKGGHRFPKPPFHKPGNGSSHGNFTHPPPSFCHW